MHPIAVLIPNLVEKVYALFGKEERDCNAMDRRITPAFVVEAAF
jgi:hypothetical protein